jgi:hypothetical protein
VDDAMSGLPLPWRADVATATWKDKPVLSLPKCVLYLGAANSVTVLYYASGSRRVLRIPTGELAGEVVPSEERCAP